jgi:hypothetical protein
MSLPINYLLHTYIVISKPKRISVAAGVVHIIMSPFIYICNTCITSIIILLLQWHRNNGGLVYGT